MTDQILLRAAEPSTDLERDGAIQLLLADSSPSPPDPGEQVLRGLQTGAYRSLTDFDGQARRVIATGLIGSRVGSMIEHMPFRKASIPILIAGVVMTVGDNVIFKDKEDKSAGPWIERTVAGVTEFGMDVAIACGAGRLMARSSWNAAGKNSIDGIINSKYDSVYVAARMGGRGPKRFPVRAHTNHSPISVGRKEARLRDYLRERGEMSKYDSIVPEIQEAHEKMWSQAT